MPSPCIFTVCVHLCPLKGIYTWPLSAVQVSYNILKTLNTIDPDNEKCCYNDEAIMNSVTFNKHFFLVLSPGGCSPPVLTSLQQEYPVSAGILLYW